MTPNAPSPLKGYFFSGSGYLLLFLLFKIARMVSGAPVIKSGIRAFKGRRFYAEPISRLPQRKKKEEEEEEEEELGTRD